MKLLVFAHTPPPHHGQSYMVELVLAGFGGDHRRHHSPATVTAHNIQCYHVNARFSDGLEDIGGINLRKFLRLLSYCLQAIWCRYRHGVKHLYYIPAPGKRSAVYRDCLVMLCCRPFFQNIIFQWQAAGLGEWLENPEQKWLQALTHWMLDHAALSIVTSKQTAADAGKFHPIRIAVVANGIPDPCPDFATTVLPARQARWQAWMTALAQQPHSSPGPEPEPHVVRVLFMAHCAAEKGLFDAMEGVRLANERLARDRSPVRLLLHVAGIFPNAIEKARFDAFVSKHQPASVVHLGFLAGNAKHQAFATADIFCFPSYYFAESFGLVLAESMAFGLPLVTTRWRSLPEVVPPGYPHLVDIQSPAQVATALINALRDDSFISLRKYFMEHYLIDRHLDNLARALRSVESAPTGSVTP